MDIQHTHIAAAGTVSALIVAASVAASVAAGSGPVVDMIGAKGTAVAILNAGAQASGGSLAIELWHSDDNSTFVDSGVGFTSLAAAASLQKLSFRPGELKRYVTLKITLAGGTSPAWPAACELLYFK